MSKYILEAGTRQRASIYALKRRYDVMPRVVWSISSTSITDRRLRQLNLVNFLAYLAVFGFFASSAELPNCRAERASEEPLRGSCGRRCVHANQLHMPPERRGANPLQAFLG